MEVPEVPNDDLMDVMEMTSKLENYISSLFNDNEKNLSISALMGASINCMIASCETLDEVIFYRNFFMQIFDSSIRNIQLKPPSPSKDSDSS